MYVHGSLNIWICDFHLGLPLEHEEEAGVLVCQVEYGCFANAHCSEIILLHIEVYNRAVSQSSDVV